MPVELPGNEEERAARALIEQAGKALGRRRPEIPATFVAQLYGRSVPEDLVRYGADDIAALAEHAYEFIVEREPGAPKIRCETVPLTASGDRKSISVIEIVNDDMPFLVDSVMGEIADRRLDVRLVAHPMFSVRRDGNKLMALDSPEPPKASVRALSVFILRRSPTMPCAKNSCARCKPFSARCGWRCRTGAPCATASTAS